MLVKEEKDMPTVTTKSGKVKHYPYTKQGKAAASLASKAAAPDPRKVNVRKVAVMAVVKPSKPKKNFGISNLKRGKVY